MYVNNLIHQTKTEENFPVSYRTDDTGYFIERLKNNNSSILLSIPGFGKSVFLRFLTFHPKVKRHYLKEEGEKTIFVHIDLNDLSESSPKDFYYLALRRLNEALTRFNYNEQLIKYVGDTYERAKISPIVNEILDELKGALSYLCFEHDIRVLMIIDKFDWACESFDTVFFNNLRAIRDHVKEKFTFLFASIRDPFKVAPKNKTRQLLDLVSPFQYYLKPLNFKDSTYEIGKLLYEKGLSLSEQKQKEITVYSGGHPSLFKSIVQILGQELKRWDSIKDSLLLYPNVQIKVRKIWEYFEREEQNILSALAKGATPNKLDPEIINNLQKKRALFRDGQKLKTFTPLLESFIHEIKNKHVEIRADEGILINKEINTVYKDGVELENPLTRMEYRLLEFIYRKDNKICERDEIAESVWGAEAIEGVSDEAIDQLITRLRGKIEDDRSSPKYIITIRGRGFRFRKNP